MTDFYVRENNKLDNYECDQNIIIERKYLPYITSLRYKEKVEKFEKSLEWWPNCNSYYVYLEDTDALNRKEILQNIYKSNSSISIASTDNLYENNCYSEKDVQNKYLSTTPISFVIIGKPGLGEHELGKFLADYWKCSYIDPETLINDEIASGSRAGQCIEFNLRCGRAISADVIMRLVEKRVKSATSEHRGFVLCGFPLIANDLFEEDPVSSESAIFNVQEIFDEFVDTIIPDGRETSAIYLTEVSSENVEAYEEVEGEEVIVKEEKISEIEKKLEIPLDIGSTTFAICAPPDPYKNVEEQIDHLFSFIPQPFIIIYIACENREVVNKRTDYRFDVITNKIVDLQKEETDKTIYSMFSNNPIETDELPEGFIYLTKYDNMEIDYTNRYDLLRLPRDFSSSIVTQLEKYRFQAMSTIEKYVLLHDPQYVIKVDGRVSPSRMFYTLKLRLDVLPLQKPLIPVNLNVPQEPTGAEDEIIQNINFDDMTMPECFELFSRKFIASPMFKWSWSDWGSKCPVSMRNGIYVNGDPKYAVQFMNKIFFLANETAFIKFYRNPRPYLLPPFPKLSSKIVVIGPKHVAKLEVAKCLGYFLDINILEMDQLKDQFLNRKTNDYLENVRLNALNEIKAKLTAERLEEHELKENERLEKLENWKLRMLKLLYYYYYKTYISSKINVIAGINIEQEKPEFAMDDSYYYDANIFKMSLEKIENELNDNYITCLCDADEMLKNPDMIIEYADDSLVMPHVYNKPNDQEDIVVEYVKNIVDNTDLSVIELTLDDLTEIYVTAIKDIEESSNQPGWIISGLPPNIKLLENVETNLPDEVFILSDTSPDHDFLVERFRNKSMIEFTDFRSLFLDNGKKEAAMRCPLFSTDTYKQRMTDDILKTIVQECTLVGEDSEDELTEEEYYKYYPRRAEIDEYRDELYEYDANIEEVKLFFQSQNISINVLDVTNTSTPSLLNRVLMVVDNKYRQPATIFTEDDREEELRDFGEQVLIPEEEEEAEDEETETVGPGIDSFLKNRRYGDTYYYCPVAFNENFVLWRGKDELAAKFENKIYFLYNNEALYKFLNDPKKYLFRYAPPNFLPPPRICITGLPGSGKTTFGLQLCRNLGLYYCNFMDSIKKINEGEALDYINLNIPLSEKIMNKVLLPLWRNEPIRTIGFVLDGFPRRASDLEHMTKFLLIPDIILDLIALQPILQERLRNVLFEQWKIKTAEEKANKDKINKNLRKEYELSTSAYMTQLLDEMRQRRYEKEKEENVYNKEEEENVYDKEKKENVEGETNQLSPIQEEDVIRIKSQVSYDSIAEEADYEEAKRLVDERFPQPKYLISWPTEEEIIIQINNEIVESYQKEITYFSGIKDRYIQESIPWMSIDANLSFDKVFTQIMKLVDPIKFRNESFFERCYDISVELAETLLNSGYYFISNFGRTCPVQYYEKYDTFQLYLSLTEKFQLYPVLHRHYVYFLAGKKNRDKFVANPLKYTADSAVEFPLISFRISIIGPPKCGKTTLSERFKTEIGLKHISIGKATRYVLNCLSYTELAKNIDEVLRNGWQLTPEMEMKCVEAMCMEASAVAIGCVFDGFPHNTEQVRHLAELGILPHLVIDLISTHSLIQEFRNTVKPKNIFPSFSMRFIQYRYASWLKSRDTFRHWLDKEYQILAKIAVQPCKWGVWRAAYDLAAAVLFEIKFYYIHAKDNTALRLSNMQVSCMEYVHRRSSYKEFCVGCLCHTNSLNCNENPPDRTGLIQYKYYYYWLCPEHVEKFIRNPDAYLSPYNPNKIPEFVATRVNLIKKPKNLQEDGFCIVCYIDNLPNRLLEEGSLKLAVEYRDKIYLFQTHHCLKKFIRQPEKYYKSAINFKGKLTKTIDIKKLPILGYLEQFAATQIIKALSDTVDKRPLICGLSIETSAALNIGLFLKVNNPNLKSKILPIYEKAFKLFNERRCKFIQYLTERKCELNPYVYYEEPIPPLVISNEQFYEENEEKYEISETAISSITDILNDQILINTDYFK